MPALEGEQILALNKLKAWWNDKEAPQYFTLVGAAGTGKSYTLTAFMEELHLDYNRVIFGTLAGKAALVLRQRGILTATTIHKLIYIPFEAINVKTKEPCIRFAKRATLPDTVELIVVDECSMIDDKIIADLLSYGKRVIFVGDKFQLKPITGVNKLMNNTPDAELTTPRRQALDNSILQVATDIRNGKVITQYGMIGNNVLRVDMDYMKKNMKLLGNSNQVICGTNSTRHSLNRTVRNLIVPTKNADCDWYPVQGDKIMCIRNDHDIGLMNGQMGQITLLNHINTEKNTCKINFVDYGLDRFNNLETILDLYNKDIPYEQLTKKQKDQFQFQYAYAITAHKSQGSEWDNIVVFEEIVGSPYLNWLYTAATRAKKNLILVEC